MALNFYFTLASNFCGNHTSVRCFCPSEAFKYLLYPKACSVYLIDRFGVGVRETVLLSSELMTLLVH
jgi:hypothetical protein